MHIRHASYWVWCHLFDMWVLVCVVWVSSPAASQETGSVNKRPMVSRVIVDLVDPAPHQKDWDASARSLIGIQNNDRFSSEKVVNAITALEASKLFQSIFADTRKSGDAVNIIFRLTPFSVIKGIRIQGGYPLFDEAVIRALSVSVGDTYVPGDMPQQAKRIEALFKREGFFDPQVTVSGRQDPKDGYVVLNIQIKRQGHFVLETIHFTGNSRISGWRLRNMMDSWRPILKRTHSGRFREQVFKADVRNLTLSYRKKGFAEVVLKPQVKRDEQTRQIAVNIQVAEGPRYRIRFKGHKAFWKHTLMNDVAIFKEGNKNDRGLRKTVRQLKERYRCRSGIPG